MEIMRIKVTVADLKERDCWIDYYVRHGIPPSTADDQEISLSEVEAREFGFIGGDDWR